MYEEENPLLAHRATQTQELLSSALFTPKPVTPEKKTKIESLPTGQKQEMFEAFCNGNKGFGARWCTRSGAQQTQQTGRQARGTDCGIGSLPRSQVDISMKRVRKDPAAQEEGKGGKAKQELQEEEKEVEDGKMPDIVLLRQKNIARNKAMMAALSLNQVSLCNCVLNNALLWLVQ